MKFEMFEDYLKQEEQNKAKRQEAIDKIKEKQAELTKAKSDYESEIKKGVKNGKPNNTKIAELDDKIDQIAKELRRVELEEEFIRSNVTQKITKDDVVNAWNNEFRPEYKAKKLDPALEKMRAAKLAYIEAIMEYHEILADYERQRVDVYTEIGNTTTFGNSHEYKVEPLNFTRTDHSKYYYLSEQEIADLKKGVKPNTDEGKAFE